RSAVRDVYPDQLPGPDRGAVVARARNGDRKIYPDRAQRRRQGSVFRLRDLAARQGLDIHDICKELCMDWEELNQLAADPLCTIGAHTVNHVMLRKLDS